MIEGQEGVTWPEWVALAGAARRTASRRCSAPTTTCTSAAGSRARVARRLGDARRARRALTTHAAARHAGLARDLPPSLDAGQGGGHRRPRVRRARRARPRRRLARARARGVRLPVPAAEGAHGHARGAARDRPRPLGRRPVRFDGDALPARGPRCAAQAGAAPAPAAASWAAPPGRARRASPRARPTSTTPSCRRPPRSASAASGRARLRGGRPRRRMPVLGDDRRSAGRDEAELRGPRARAAPSGAAPTRSSGRPPSGWIVGTLEEAAEQLAALRDAGVHRVMLQNLLHRDLDVLALIGDELPALL